MWAKFAPTWLRRPQRPSPRNQRARAIRSTLALGANGYRSFRAHRQDLHAAGGDLLLIGWPDGTTITYSRDDRTAPLSLDTLADSYRASATLFRIGNPKAPA